MALTDNDKRFGPITYGKTNGWKPFRIVVSSGDDEDPGNTLTAYVGGYVATVGIGNWLKPYREKVIAAWSDEIIRRVGRNYYYVTYPCEYGFSLDLGESGGLQLFYGRQSNESNWSKNSYFLLPWKERVVIQHEILTPSGTVSSDVTNVEFMLRQQLRERAGKETHTIVDYDGTLIQVECSRERIVYGRGTSWCKWMRYVWPKETYVYMNLEFSSEVGCDKGSWKGGMTGTVARLVSHDEPTVDALRRFCNQEHRSKHGPYKLKLVE